MAPVRKNSKTDIISPPDFQLDIKENEWIIVDYQDFGKTFQSITTVLKATGINIDLTKDKTDGLIYKTIRIVLIFYSIFTIVLSLYHSVRNIIFKKASEKLNFSVLYNSDQVITLTILLHWSVRGRKVISALRQLAQLFRSLNVNSNSYQKVRRFSIVLASVTSVTTCYMCISAWVRMAYHEKLNGDIEFSQHLFGLQYPEKNVGKMITSTMGFAYAVLMLCVNLYSSLIIVVSYAIYICLVNLNKMLTMADSRHLTLRHFNVFLKKHQEISVMVQTTNSVFSPIILVTICIKTMKIVMSFKELNYAIKHFNHDELAIIAILYVTMTFMLSVFVVVVLTLTAGKLYTQAQTCFDLMLNVSLENPEIYSDKLLNVFKSFHLTTLFSAQRLTTPVGITASDLFTINYNFLFVVISTSVTYVTLIPN